MTRYPAKAVDFKKCTVNISDGFMGNKISSANEKERNDPKKMEVNESAAYPAVLAAFDLVLLSWSLLRALTLSLCSQVLWVFKLFLGHSWRGN